MRRFALWVHATDPTTEIPPQGLLPAFHRRATDEGGPDLMLELDLYWVDHAGVNCERVLERCHGRVPVIHIKDKEAVEEGPVMAPIGEGNLDWPHILPACDAAGVEWIAIEQGHVPARPHRLPAGLLEYLQQFRALPRA